jgi:hypothetical protein
MNIVCFHDTSKKKCTCKDINFNNSIYFNEDNGNIIIDDANVGKYNFEITYSYNQKISTVINFEILPVVLYDNNTFEFYEGDINIIEKPYVNPSKGKFYLNADNLAKYFKIDNYGNIYINKELTVGNYEFCVIYEYNKIIYSTKFYINIKPYILYTNISIDYKNNFIHNPSFLIKNHGITNFILNENLNINTIGQISNFNNLEVGLHIIKIEYFCKNEKYETFFSCEILPIINIDLSFNTINFYPEGGNLIYDNSKITINNNNIIYNHIYDDNIVPITYNFNNVNKTISLKIKSMPIKVFDSEINIIYGTIDKIDAYIKEGNISSLDKPFNLNIENLSLNITNLDVGNYSFNII